MQFNLDIHEDVESLLDTATYLEDAAEAAIRPKMSMSNGQLLLVALAHYLSSCEKPPYAGEGRTSPPDPLSASREGEPRGDDE